MADKVFHARAHRILVAGRLVDLEEDPNIKGQASAELTKEEADAFAAADPAPKGYKLVRDGEEIRPTQLKPAKKDQ